MGTAGTARGVWYNENMKIVRPKNTKRRGLMEFLFYRQGSRYIGVCLTFNILEEGKDLELLKRSVEEAARLHLIAVIKKNLSDDLLNRHAPKKYWEKYFVAQKQLARERAEVMPQSTASNTRYTLSGILGSQSRASVVAGRA